MGQGQDICPHKPINTMTNRATLLQQLELQVELHLQKAVTVYQNLPEESLHRKPDSGGWSAAQCLWHLNSYSAFYLPEIENAIQKAGTDPGHAGFTSSWLGKWFTNLMQPGKGKYKAFAKHTPPEILNGLQEVADFIAYQETLLSLLRKSNHVNLNAVRVPVSITSWVKLPLGDVFQFLIAHEERHLQQAEKVLGMNF